MWKTFSLSCLSYGNKYNRPVLLSEYQRHSELKPFLSVNEWQLATNRDAIMKKYVFKNFVEAFGFMTKCAVCVEAMNHHPEWLNVYNSVTVTLTTHDCQGISELDLKLAKQMDELANETLQQQS